VITRREALRLGLTSAQITYRLRTREWRPVHRGVYALAGTSLPPEGILRAAWAAAGPGAMASHRSAGWLWELLERPPTTPSLRLPPGSHRVVAGVELYRSARRARPCRRAGILVTNPLSTLVDLATCVLPEELDDAIDVALARRLLRPSQLELVARPDSTSRRRGVGPLRHALENRGFLGAPGVSVLESRMLRLLKSWGIVPTSIEQWVCGGTYRVDFVLGPSVVLETDGYAFHSSPDAKAGDSRRRNDLRAAGYTVIEADWVTVVAQPQLLRTQIEAILARSGVDTGVRLGRRRSASS
jgi:hypothetical protein